ncbi:carbonic anhydrase, partial [Micromonospora sp. M51]
MSHAGNAGGQPGTQRTTDRAPVLSEPSRAYAELVAGNRRFVGGAPHHPNQDAGHRAAVADGQHPFAVIVGCSDSRLAAEIIFDRGLGDLFVV